MDYLTRDEAEFVAGAAEEFTRLVGEQLPLTLAPVAALNLIAQLQLALRHPGNHGPSAATGRELVRAVREWFAAHDCPSVIALIDRGDDPRYDAPPPRAPVQ